MSSVLAMPVRARPLSACRADFPALRRPRGGPPLHYLDNAATTQQPRSVIDAMARLAETGVGPVQRGLYPLAEQATALYEQARATVARFIGAQRADELVFTRSATEAINLIAWGWLRPRLQPGERVWVTRMEHHANLLPWQRVCRECGAELRVIELGADGKLDLERASAAGLFDPRTRLIALTLVSNVLGVENPVADLCAAARAPGIPVLVDAAQAVGHQPLDVGALGCDFLAFSAHKMCGPTGIGALWGRAEQLAATEPLLVGGGMVDLVRDDDALWAPVPERFEAGSPNLVAAVGFAAAADYLTDLGMARIAAHVGALARRAVDALAELPGLRLLPGPATPRTSIVSFDIDGVHPHDIAQIAAEQGVALRAGHHCCQPLMRHLGLAATARASFAPYNDADDVDALVGALQQVIRVLR
jgi:cysteine desulfurase/selenocysteine lyase